MGTQLGSSLVGSEFLDPKGPAKGGRVITNNRATGPESMRLVTNGYDSRLSSQLADKLEEKVAAAREKDLGAYAALIRKSVDARLTSKESDQLVELVLKLGIDGQQVDADQKDYMDHKQLSGTDWKAEADAAQKDCFEATARLREIEQVELPKLRKESANKKARVSLCSASRQKLEAIERGKPWLIATPAPAEK